MKVNELIQELIYGAVTPPNTCDTIKTGDGERTLSRVAVTMFGTADVIRAAHAWGADLLIVHEPIYYDHMDHFCENPITLAKRNLIRESGMVIYRYHDHAHFRERDLITYSELHYLGLTGMVEKTDYAASYLFTSDTPVSALELANRMERELGVKHIRIAGSRDHKATRIAACFGTPGGVQELLCRDDVEMVITGEACEWALSECARDAASLGIPKSLIVMGHIGSERDGMRRLAEMMQAHYTEFETRYFECGEVYSYTDS